MSRPRLHSGKSAEAPTFTRLAHSCDQPPYSSLERDFCHRRLARQKGPEGDVSAQRQEIGDHHTREMAAKRLFCWRAISCGFRKTGWWAHQDGRLEKRTCSL